jgi:hypothetical protein
VPLSSLTITEIVQDCSVVVLLVGAVQDDSSTLKVKIPFDRAQGQVAVHELSTNGLRELVAAKSRFTFAADAAGFELPAGPFSIVILLTPERTIIVMCAVTVTPESSVTITEIVQD